MIAAGFCCATYATSTKYLECTKAAPSTRGSCNDLKNLKIIIQKDTPNSAQMCPRKLDREAADHS